MTEHAIYFGKPEIYQTIRTLGGIWNDIKERLHKYLQKDRKNIQSCFYHIGNTNEKSIFFISDIIPITDKYISRKYLNKNHLIQELNYESSNPDFPANQHTLLLTD